MASLLAGVGQLSQLAKLWCTHTVIRSMGPVLISSFWGRQPAADISHKPSSRLSLLSVRPAVTFPASVHS